MADDDEIHITLTRDIRDACAKALYDFEMGDDGLVFDQTPYESLPEPARRFYRNRSDRVIVELLSTDVLRRLFADVYESGFAAGAKDPSGLRFVDYRHIISRVEGYDGRKDDI